MYVYNYELIIMKINNCEKGNFETNDSDWIGISNVKWLFLAKRRPENSFNFGKR